MWNEAGASAWRVRSKLTGTRPPPDDDYPAVRALREHWDRDETEMRAWIVAMSDDDLVAPVTVNRLHGFALEAYLTHVVTHALQSFSEAGVLLTAAGQSVGDVDFLDSYDDRGGAEA